MYVDGLFEGSIDSSDDISIGRHGCIRGRVRARNVTVSGTLEGDLICDQLHIERDDQVRATVCSDNLSIDPQGCFVGERRLQATPQLEYRPEHTDTDTIDYSLIDSLPDRITLSAKGS